MKILRKIRKNKILNKNCYIFFQYKIFTKLEQIYKYQLKLFDKKYLKNQIFILLYTISLEKVNFIIQISIL